MGIVWKLHNNVNTDEIIPGRYNVTTDRDHLAKYCLCEVRPDFPAGVHPGDVIVAGKNFGCGSSREHAPVALQACGVLAVIAPSFARIFYRNSINVGLPLLVSPDASAAIQEGDKVEIDLGKGAISSRDQTFQAEPIPDFVQKIAASGGILEFIKTYGWEGI